jgi:predicted DNA-binding transcriptional regulator AlpA
MKITIHGEEYFDIKEIQKCLDTNKTSLYEKMRYDRFPKPLKLESRSFWKRAEIESYIESTRQGRGK